MKVRKTRIIDRHSWHGGYEGLFSSTYSCRAHQNVLLTLTCWQSFGGVLQLNFSNCVSSGWMETLKMCLNKQADMQTRLVRISSVSVLRPWALPPLSTTEHCKRGIYGWRYMITEHRSLFICVRILKAVVRILTRLIWYVDANQRKSLCKCATIKHAAAVSVAS